MQSSVTMPQQRYLAAPTFAEFLETAEANKDLWHAVNARAVISEDILARVAALPGRWHLLVLNEDWCGDAVNSVPYVARLAELAPNLEMRVLGRDANPDLMDAHLTNNSRSIPVVIVLDEEFAEHGWWGPRPKELQSWVLGPGMELDKETRYREVRRWYARDRGRTTLEELVALLERVAAQAVSVPEVGAGS